ncbi:hypothetical protein JHK87_023211 [Glycine soja]|nr:hypothetical protein JHK87_023211 [Glycine soja]
MALRVTAFKGRQDQCSNLSLSSEVPENGGDYQNLEQREPKFQRGVAKFGSNACNNTPAQQEDVGSVPIGPPIISSYEKYLKDCTAKLHPHCGDQFYSGIFFGTGTISKDCCKNVVTDVGKACYDNMTKKLVSGSPQFKPNQAQILSRSNEIWNDCILA